FADDREFLPADRQRDAAHRLDRTGAGGEGDAQIGDVDQHHRCLGSSTSRKPSPSRLKASDTVRMAMPGAVGTHHCSKMKRLAVATIAPHSGEGGCAPMPRNPRLE